jgi:hypothetical protein
MRRMLGLGVLEGREAMCWARRPVRAEPEVPAPLDGLTVTSVEGGRVQGLEGGTRLCSRIHRHWRRGV